MVNTYYIQMFTFLFKVYLVSLHLSCRTLVVNYFIIIIKILIIHNCCL